MTGQKMNFHKMERSELIELLIKVRHSLIGCEDAQDTVLYISEMLNVDQHAGATNEYEEVPVVFNIMVNGRRQVVGSEVSYEEVVRMANETSSRNLIDQVVSVTYARAEDNRDGNLFPGKSVKVTDKTVFYAAITDNA